MKYGEGKRGEEGGKDTEKEQTRKKKRKGGEATKQSGTWVSGRGERRGKQERERKEPLHSLLPVTNACIRESSRWAKKRKRAASARATFLNSDLNEAQKKGGGEEGRTTSSHFLITLLVGGGAQKKKGGGEREGQYTNRAKREGKLTKTGERKK